jgi:hypothetical protein
MKYRANVVERVAAAQNAQARTTGVNAVQQRHDLPSPDDFIRANPDKFTRLTSPGDCFIADQLLAVPYG